MHLTHALEDGEHRIYVTRHASVVTYFAPSDDGRHVELHVEPGWSATHYDMERNAETVRQEALIETATRLGVNVEAVLLLRFRDLLAVVDPDLPRHYRYARRSQNRSQAFR